MTAAKTATFKILEDASAFELVCDRIRLVIEADPRRNAECWTAYGKLKARGEVIILVPQALGPDLMLCSVPHPSFVALHASLLLRSRLDLPAGAVA